jgi:hypothetical protein
MYSGILLSKEVTMDKFFPFIHKKIKKQEFEPEPLYVEIYPPPQEKREKNEEEKEERIIIIQL